MYHNLHAVGLRRPPCFLVFPCRPCTQENGKTRQPIPRHVLHVSSHYHPRTPFCIAPLDWKRDAHPRSRCGKIN